MPNRSQKSTSRFSGIGAIGSDEFKIKLNGGSDGILRSFNCSTQLKEGYNPKHLIVLYVQFFVQRRKVVRYYKLGCTIAPQTIDNVEFGFSITGYPKFRLALVDPESLKLFSAQSSWIETNETGVSEPESLIDLLSNNELGERLWKLQLTPEQKPTLLYNNRPELNAYQRIKSDEQVRAYLMPAVLTEVLYEIARASLEQDIELDWVGDWDGFIEELGIEVLPSDPEKHSRWVSDAVGKFCNYHKLASKLIAKNSQGQELLW